MKKQLALALLITLAPAVTMAAGENNIGSCGWGAKLFDGQKGVVPQVLAVTTNGTSGNQTFGISTGTSGCTQDGAIKSNWKMAMFIDGNKEKVARDMSVGHGEALDALASLIGVRSEDKPAFFQAAKDNFGRIFTSENASTDQILASLKQVLADSGSLAAYSTAI